MLCHLCQNLPPLLDLHDFQHHTLDNLQQSAAAGCALCSHAWVAIKNSLDRNPAVAQRDRQVRMSIQITRSSASLRLNYDTAAFNDVYLDLCCDPNNSTCTQTPNLHVVKSRLLSHSYRSDESLNFIRATIQNCAATHDRRCCPLNENVVLPTLVLNIQTAADSHLVLVHNNDGSLKGRYVTLSYCWGPAGAQASTRLTKARLESYKRGIPLTNLPQTLRDAVYVTRKLGFQYLWIDSLCIIQDDESSRQQQLRHMARIYMQSYATIQASIPRSVDDGFLAVDRRPAMAPAQVPFEIDAASGQTSYVLVRQIHTDTGQDTPAAARAWIFQETILSTRLIRYGARNVVVSCRFESCSEDGTGSAWTDLGPRDYFRLRPDLDPSEALSTSKPGPPRTYRREALETWYRTISHLYSPRLYAQSDDRLAALVAYAEEAHHVIGGDYLAGLWSVDLVRSLQWKPTFDYLRGTVSRYRAPSWSWAAYDGQVQYHGRQEGLEGLSGREIQDMKSDRSGQRDDSWTPTIFEAWTTTTTTTTTTTIDTSPYGACRAGQIVMEARVGWFSIADKNVLHAISPSQPKSFKFSMVMLQEERQESKLTQEHKNIVCCGWPDTAVGIPSGCVLPGVFLTPDWGLILVESGDGHNTDEKQFRRVGHFLFFKMFSPQAAYTWKNACQRRKITLV